MAACIGRGGGSTSRPRSEESRDLSFVEYLELLKDARRRQCQPAVVLHPNLLTDITCSQCGFPEALGRAQAAMTPCQSIDDLRMSDVVPPSDLAESTAIVPEIVHGKLHPAHDILAMRAACLSCAKNIYRETRHLQEAVSSNGDTALHCAARAGNLRMVCHLLSLAEEEAVGDGYAAAMAAARRLNARNKETVLHQAVRSGRFDMVELLMWVDPMLALVPAEGTSPMYLAVSLGNTSIARLLYLKSGGNLSWSGPEEKNVFHAAVFHDEGNGTTTV